MRYAAFLCIMTLAACDAQRPAHGGEGAGQALERTALASGMISDPARLVPTGVYGGGEDKVCLVPTGTDRYRVGASVDLGEQQHCVGRGSARGRDKLDVNLSESCAFVATLDGDRISFPAVLPSGCDTVCEGRVTLAALEAERLSDSVAEATRVDGADGRPLCAG